MENKGKGCSVGILITLAIIVTLFLLNRILLWWALGLLAFLVVLIIVAIASLNAKEKLKKQEPVATGLTVGDVEDLIKSSNQKLQNIRRDYYDLKDSGMREELDRISTLCRKIFDNLRTDPGDVKISRRFLGTMLPSLERIVTQSVQIGQSPVLNEEGKAVLEDAKEGLVLLRKATESHINKLNENNILDLDVEISVMKKSLAARGLLEDDTMKGENDD